ncbi:MAG: acetamidase/formamidase family protein [Candidatus Bathyarchaeia archaeon]
MKRVKREKAVQYAFTNSVKPILKVKKGEEFIVETWDAIGNRIKTREDLPVPEVLGELTDSTPMKANFLAGPIFVEGAEKGDVLAVDILDVVPADHGVNFILPGFGPLADSLKYRECVGPFTHIIKHTKGPSGTTSDGEALLETGETWRLMPFIGTIGVAPEWETLGSLISQGPWGGNLDCRDVCKGSRIYLPVFNKGALLFLGDVHGCQADTEFCGVADECAAELRLACNVIKKKRIPFVRIEKEKSIVQLSCYRPLEEAVKRACLWMIDWLVEDYGKSQRDAYIHLSINPKVRVNVYQMLMADRLEFTVGVEFPKEHL